jgi:hypothetical protein
MDDYAVFQEAIDGRDYVLLQEALEGKSKKEAVEHLHSLFPHKEERWFSRNLPYLMALDPLGLYEVLGHSDPTANKAIREVMKEHAA